MIKRSLLPLFTASLALLSACTEAPAPETAEVLRPVRYSIVQATQGGQERGFSGVAKASISSKLSFRVSGSVQSFTVKTGDTVRKGQTLATVDSQDLKLQLQQSRAAQVRAEAEARNTEANYSRVRALYENQSSSRNELDGSRAAYESARALVDSAQQQTELARQQLSYSTLRSPFDGCTVAATFIENNENVSAGQPILELSCGDSLEIVAAVPENYISSVREGQSVSIYFDTLPQQRFAATVTEVGVATRGTTTYPVTALLSETDQRMRAGMAAELAFTADPDGKAKIWLPTVAVAEDRSGRYVYIAQPEGERTAVLQRRTITIGELSSLGMEITSGLVDGEHVVIAGVSKVQDGQRVKLLANQRR